MTSVTDQHAKHHRLIDLEHAPSPEDLVLTLMFRKAYERAAEAASGPILDLGCNTGYGTAILRRLTGQEVVGVDVSPRAIETARERWGGDFRVADAHALPFEDGHFATVTCFQVIEHIEDTDAFLREIGRVLRPGGRAYFTTPNAATRLDPGGRPWNRFHVREFWPHELRDALRPHFHTVRIEGLFGSPELEAIERPRVARLRAIGRWRNRVAWLLPLVVEDRLIRALKAIGRAVRGRDTGTGAGGAAGARGEGAAGGVALPDLDTSDLRYDTEELDRSLDLMAVCER